MNTIEIFAGLVLAAAFIVSVLYFQFRRDYRREAEINDHIARAEPPVVVVMRGCLVRKFRGRL